ncbi:hypothetical protein ACTS9C_02945 [Empedobacter brevis]
MKKTFTEEFSISDKNIDFFDIPVEEDILVFICPFLIENTKSNLLLSKKVYDRLVMFLTKLNKDFVQPNKRNLGISFLSHLHEPNEIHFGYSSKNKGKAVAKEKAVQIFDALRRNKSSKQGLHTTNEAHNVLLLVEGIGQDIMSDITLNVCRDLFSEFTETQIKKYKIVGKKTFKIEYYNDKTEKWENKDYDLPIYNNKNIILIPKEIVAGKRGYSTRFNWFVASNYISADLMKKPIKKTDKLFRELKDGTKKAIIKEIYKAYKKPKDELIKFVIQYPGSLDEFIAYAKEHYPAINFDKIKKR